MKDKLVAHLTELSAVAAASAESLGPAIERAAAMVQATVKRGGTLYFCGNGGSAAEAQHMSTEYVVRYQRERRPIAAIALTTDTSIITAHANDYSFETLFSRQVEALCRAGDLLILSTTSGKSPNLLAAIHTAREKSVATIAISAKGGGPIAEEADHTIVIPTDRTDRAQEISLAIQHAICDQIDQMV
jgi:D-sedoheptulose 7-phosphate isomerase